eukprot:3013422-Lingulodinium_polyedra.AAC.1
MWRHARRRAPAARMPPHLALLIGVDLLHVTPVGRRGPPAVDGHQLLEGRPLLRVRVRLKPGLPEDLVEEP